MVDPTSIDVSLSMKKSFPSCDHYPVIFKLQQSLDSGKGKKVIQFRNMKGIDQEQFSEDLADSLSAIELNNSSYQTTIEQFNTVCKSVLDAHAPKMTKTINDIPEAPWFDGEYKVARMERRRAEKQWRKTKLEIDHSIFINLRQHCDELSLMKKNKFFNDTFEKYNHSQKSLYKFVDTFMDNDGSLDRR